MRDPVDILACKNDDFEEYDRCDEPPPTGPPGGPPGGGGGVPPGPGSGPIGPCELGPPPVLPAPPEAPAAQPGPFITIQKPPANVTRIIRVKLAERGQLQNVGWGTGTITFPITADPLEITYLEIPVPAFNLNDPLSLQTAIYMAVFGIVDPATERIVSWEFALLTEPGIAEATGVTAGAYDVTWRVEDYDATSGQLYNVWSQDCEWFIEEAAECGAACVTPRYLWDPREQGDTFKDVAGSGQDLEIDARGAWQSSPPMRVYTPVGSWTGGAASALLMNLEDIPSGLEARVHSQGSRRWSIGFVYDINISALSGNTYVFMEMRYETADSNSVVSETLTYENDVNGVGDGYSLVLNVTGTYDYVGGLGHIRTFDFIPPDGLHTLQITYDPDCDDVATLYIDGAAAATAVVVEPPAPYPPIQAIGQETATGGSEPDHEGSRIAAYAAGNAIAWWSYYGSTSGAALSTGGPGGKQGITALWPCARSAQECSDWHDEMKLIYTGLP